MGLSEALSELFPYVCAIYIFDSVANMRSGWVSLSISFGQASISRRTGLMFVGLLPWKRTYILNYSNFLPASQSAFFLYQDSKPGPLYRASDYREIPYGSAASSEAFGQNLMVNSDRAAIFPSAGLAHKTAALLGLLSGSGQDERLSIVKEHLNQRFDQGALRDRRELLHWPMLIISLLSIWAFVLQFTVLPLWLYTGIGQHLSLGRILISIAIVAVLTFALSSYHFYTKLSRSAGGTLMFMLPFLLLPISAPLMAAAIRRQAYAAFDVLSIASLHMKEEALRAAALSEYRKLNISMEALGETLGEPSGEAAFSEALSLRRDALMRLLVHVGISVEGAGEPPEQRDPVAEAYCPSCHTEYRACEGPCVDCGISLKKYTQD